VALALNNLARLLQATDRATEAEPLFRRALKIDEACYGSDHPDVAIDLNNLASLLHDTNRTADAEPLFRRALAIFEASYGPDHPHTRGVRGNLTALHASRPASAPVTALTKPGGFLRVLGALFRLT
jgi:tetratricopeptide (TPR) repeat protein